MNKCFLFFTGIVLLLGNFFLSSVSFAAAEEPDASHLDKIVAVVNSDVITQSELQQRMAIIKAQLAKANEPISDESKLRSKVLDSLIDRALELQLAKRNKIVVSDEDLAHAIESVAKSNHMTLAKMKEAMAKEGVSFDAFSKELREEILFNRLYQQAFGRQIVVSDKEIDEIIQHPTKLDPNLQEYHVVDILIPTSDKAVQILDKLRAGTDLDTIMKADASIKRDDLGWRRLGGLPTIFAAEVIKIQVGNVAGPVEAPNGYHLLKLEAVRGGENNKVKFTREQAQELAFRKKIQEKTIPWLKEVRAGAYIKIMD
ncbi:MAG: SurA N-terminal domain-containing protein [Gammaproteobacteria bacterium]|nr:SurA N-terminal domain-containing protein [Gammaproteobacteria bacterium]